MCGSRRGREVLIAAVLAAGGSGGPLPACGPYFPNRVLLDGELLESPRADFRLEIERLLPDGARPAPAARRGGPIHVDPAGGPDDPRRKRDRPQPEVEREELLEALAAAGTAGGEAEAIAQAHAEIRAAMAAAVPPEESWRAARPEGAKENLAALAVPAGLPGEFDDYVRGALRYDAGDVAGARDVWEKLLSRPPAERRFRSTWAAFMIGKSWLDCDPARAIAGFEATRSLAAAGFEDRLDLAGASRGWEARAELERGDHGRAMALYLDRHAAGDPTALASLEAAASLALQAGPEALRKLAADAKARAVITAHILHGHRWDAGGRKRGADWLAAVERSGAGEVDGADRLAWLAYGECDLDAAERWAARAPAGAAVALWIRAKLALLGGRLDEAAALLARVVRTFPPDESWDTLRWTTYPGTDQSQPPALRALGELGALRLARRQYVEALDALVRSGYWDDAAYVAERVLTVEELEAYVDREWKDAVPGAGWKYREWESRPAGEGGHLVNWLLARRLARAGRLEKARPHFPADFRPRFDAYARAIREGRDRGRTASARADSLFAAARIARKDGLELFGTEEEPDWRLVDGEFDLEPIGKARKAAERSDRFARASADEASRIAGPPAAPDKRFHYRYAAADLAWEAAALLPDGDDRTARILCEAGRWLGRRDPKAADRFYKALVRRCRATELGREADRLRWFPDLGGGE